jgi:predicted lipid-binding transport protein (Tim44 family)
MLRRLGRLRQRVADRHARGWRKRRAPISAGRTSAEIEELLELARSSFMQLQRAWDHADLGAMRLMATAPLLEDLREQLAQRGPEPNCTEVLQLDARLLAVEELAEAFVASVEFSGLIRERQGEGALPFRELWLLADVKAAGRGWKLARVQSLS